MNYIIFGANVSGIVAHHILINRGNTTQCFIDKSEKSIDLNISSRYQIYSNINCIPSETLEKTDAIMVAVGNKESALKIKEMLQSILRRTIYIQTIFDEEYLEMYSFIYKLYHLKMQGYLYEKGWFHTYETRESVNLYGNPIPWIVYPCIDFLENRIHKDMLIFEYGCGNSTLWWAEKAKNVYSCEHDADWYNKMKNKIPENVYLSHVPLEYGGEYCGEIKNYENLFDVIVIDGRDRVRCAMNAVNALKTDGVIIWDNSERTAYKKGIEFLMNKGFKRIEFNGMGPITEEKFETSIFYRANNCLGI